MRAFMGFLSLFTGKSPLDNIRLYIYNYRLSLRETILYTDKIFEN